MSRYAAESEVQGNVWKLLVAVGDTVSEGDTLLIIESMKVEIPLESPASGTVVEVLVAPQEAVAEEQVLVVIDGG